MVDCEDIRTEYEFGFIKKNIFDCIPHFTPDLPSHNISFSLYSTTNSMSHRINISEEELLSRLLSKDKEAFRILYDNYSSALFGIVLKIVGTTEVAEDVLQEAFIKIWKNFSSYDKSKGRLFTWLLNIARNTAIDKLRSKNEKYQIQSIDDNVYQVDKKNNTTMKVEHIGVKQNVMALKAEHRVIIDLAYYGGYTQEEISKELNIPLGTVKTRMRNAIIELRKIF